MPQAQRQSSLHVLAIARVVATLGQAATILVTWPLWTQRTFPPAVPLVPIDLPWDVLLLLSLVPVMVWPKVGIPLHVILLILSVVSDQIRLQPYFVTIAVVMIGTLPYRSLQMSARAFLLGLWFFAGLHKMIGFEGYVHSGGGVGLVHGAFPWLPWKIAFALAALAPVLECAVAILVFFRRTRAAGAVLAAALHMGILTILIYRGHNHSVWPWNAVVGVAAICLFYNWQESFFEALRPLKRLAQAIVIATIVYPVGYYFPALSEICFTLGGQRHEALG